MTTTYYRSGKGRKAHASYSCISSRRSIWWGETREIPAKELKNWAGCLHCCTAAQIVELAEGAAPKESKNCPNSGIKHAGQRRLYSNCVDCNKEGKVNGSTGRIRAHLPQAA